MKPSKAPAKTRARKPSPRPGQTPPVVEKTSKCRCIAGVGASAGGLDALRGFFSAIPADSGAAFVVVGHHGAQGSSDLPLLLSSSANGLSVRWAAHRMEVRPNTVYISPGVKDVVIRDGRLELLNEKPGEHVRLPVDFFLQSLALDCGDKAVAIILSGTGLDGAHGLSAVKEAGGLAMVQSKSSAEFNGMPGSSIATGLADYILPPRELAGALLHFLNYQPSTRPPQGNPGNQQAQEQLRKLTALLKRHAGLDLGAYKEGSVARRIERRMGICRIGDFEDYVTMAQEDPGECEKLAKDMLISVTRFFRDPTVFEKLQTGVLPEMIRAARGRTLRIWSIGCATGEEVYSSAILLEELIQRREGRGEVDYKIFATDLDRSALDHAGKGIFPESIKADVPPDLLEKYFTRQGHHYQILRSIRQKIVFARQNILRDPPFTKLDMISCRNLLIYLQPEHQRRVLSLMHFSLNPGGILVLGLSETPGEAGGEFAPIDSKLRIYRKKGDASQSVSEMLSFGSITPLSNSLSEMRGSAAAAVNRSADRLLEEFASDVIRRLGYACIVLNKKLEILYRFGRSGDFLPSSGVSGSVTFAKLAPKELSTVVSAAADKVFADGRPVNHPAIAIGQGRKMKLVDLRVEAFKSEDSDQEFLFVFLGMTGAGDPAKPPVPDSTDARRRIRQLEDELQAKKESLQTVVEELEASNEELQTSNEELQATNEELHSTNEELQSVNEELQNVNAECQEKIHELLRTNEDIDNFIAGAGIATIFLDPGLRIRRFSPTAARQTGLLPQDIGRLITELAHPFLGLAAKASRKILAGNKKIETVISQKNGATILMRVTPFLGASGEACGATASFIDITQIEKIKSAILR